MGSVNAAVAALQSWPAQIAGLIRRRTLADAYTSGIDNFLMLRFLAATMVVYGHGYPLSGMQKLDIFVRAGFGADSGKIAVSMFFCISGFLVTGSLVRWQNVIAFIKARALRLFPAYAACLLLCAYVLGPLVTTLPLRAYLRQHVVHTYVTANLGLRSVHFVLPGVTFGDGPAHDIVNGSIWTLPAEASMYLWLAALGLMGVYRRSWLAISVIFAMIAFATSYWSEFPMLIDDVRYLPFAGLFAVGSLCYLLRKYVPLGHGWMLAFPILTWATYGSALFDYSMALAIAYFCFWFAYCLPWHGFNRLGDYSYGIYLWGFPCEQLVVRWLDHPRPAQISLIAFPMALALAVASWHLIEQPALRLKKVPLLARLRIARDNKPQAP